MGWWRTVAPFAARPPPCAIPPPIRSSTTPFRHRPAARTMTCLPLFLRAIHRFGLILYGERTRTWMVSSIIRVQTHSCLEFKNGTTIEMWHCFHIMRRLWVNRRYIVCSLSFSAVGCQWRQYHRNIFIYIAGPLCSVGIFLNLLSLFALSRYNAMQPTTRFLLQNLAIADSLFIITCFTIFLRRNQIWELIVLPFLFHLPAVWLIVVVTAERYVAICWPTRASQLCTMSNARRAVLVVYVIFILLMSTLGGLIHKVLSEENAILQSILRSHIFNVTVLVHNILDFLLPLCLIIFFNCRLMKAVRESFAIRRQHKRMHASDDPSDANNERNCTMQLIAVISVFIICQLPTFVTIICQTVSNYCYHLSPTYLVSVTNCSLLLNILLMIFNSSVNFILYVLSGKKFRSTVHDLFCCRLETAERQNHDTTLTEIAQKSHAWTHASHTWWTSQARSRWLSSVDARGLSTLDVWDLADLQFSL